MSEANPEIVQLVEEALHQRGYRKMGPEWYFRCPSHDDTRPSARYHPERSAWTCDVCGSGGGALDLAQRLGLQLPERGSAALNIVATYDYRDERGLLLSQVCRLEPKSFRQRKADGTWGLEGVRRVLYRLPDLLARPDDPVYVVEGEKDVDALRALGLVATCNMGGAGKGKWLPEYSRCLAGRNVAILPDNDAPGREHAEAIRASLEAVARRVRVVGLPGLPEKGDVSDWLAAGGTAEQLAALAWPPDRDGYKAAEDILAEPDDDRERTPTGYRDLDILLSGGMARGQLVIVAARPGVGKSSFAAGIVHAAAAAGRVSLFCSLEMDAREVASRVRNYGDFPPATVMVDDQMSRSLGEMRALALAVKDTEGSIDVMVVDYLQLMSGGTSDNRSTDLAAISRGLKMLARELAIPVVALSQLNRQIEMRGKDDRQPKLSDLRESGALEQDADVAIFLDRRELWDQDVATNLRGVGTAHVLKNRRGPIGTIPLGWWPERAAWYDLEPVSDRQGGPVLGIQSTSGALDELFGVSEGEDHGADGGGHPAGDDGEAR